MKTVNLKEKANKLWQILKRYFILFVSCIKFLLFFQYETCMYKRQSNQTKPACIRLYLLKVIEKKKKMKHYVPFNSME